MAPKIPPSIPKTATHAKKAGYKPTAKIKHADLSDAEKKQWAMVKPGAPHIICYYDPNTGEYTNCVSSNGS
ncbi:MAG: hypothetical protein WAN65_08320 [Candidatus Sulfotelmatobacter sp.]